MGDTQKVKFTTQNELAFIAFLGLYSREGLAIGRLPLLRSYRQALLRRADWGDVDRALILEHIDRCIHECERDRFL